MSIIQSVFHVSVLFSPAGPQIWHVLKGSDKLSRVLQEKTSIFYGEEALLLDCDNASMVKWVLRYKLWPFLGYAIGRHNK